jgi:PD-(D/E)XK nuclease superfamily
MTLPEGFLFSQSNLQDFVDCQRRFQLRHLLHLAWPAVEAEPYLENERRIDQGAQFHKIVRQYLLGVPETKIEITIAADEIMATWWENFLSATRSGNLSMIVIPDNQLYEEINLSVPLEKFRLMAKYDLLIIHPDGR